MLTVRLKNLGLKAGMKVLDLGCGEGRHIHGIHMVEGVQCVGLDLDLTSLAKAREGLNTVKAMLPGTDGFAGFCCGSAYDLPFGDNTFDVVICSEVLEHLDAYPRALQEIRRVLKPSGTFAATVPHAWPERLCWKLAPPPNGYPFEPGGHIRIFDDVHLRFEIINLGYRFRGKHHAHGLHTPYWWLKCLFWSRRDDHPLIRSYHAFLVWDILKKPLLTRGLEWLTAPVIGKSVALYFEANEK